jgi:hypothetical protein
VYQCTLRVVVVYAVTKHLLNLPLKVKVYLTCYVFVRFRRIFPAKNSDAKVAHSIFIFNRRLRLVHVDPLHIALSLSKNYAVYFNSI